MCGIRIQLVFAAKWLHCKKVLDNSKFTEHLPKQAQRTTVYFGNLLISILGIWNMWKNLVVGSRVALSRESTSVLSGGAGTRVCALGSFRHRWRPSDVQTLRHMFLIIRDSNNIMVEEFRVISCYQRAPLFIVVSLGGLMGLKPLGARDLKSNYAHSGEWLRQMECLLLSCLCSLQADQEFALKQGPPPPTRLTSKLSPLLNAVPGRKP